VSANEVFGEVFNYSIQLSALHISFIHSGAPLT